MPEIKIVTEVSGRICALPVELGASAYRALPHGELAVLPNTANGITPAALQITTEFFQRSAG